MNFTAFAILSTFVAGGAQALTYDDFTSDLSNDPNAPTALVLGIGTHSISGSVTTPSDTRDYLSFEIGAGEQLTDIILQSYVDGTVGGPGNRGYHALSAGATSAIPGFTTGDDFLAGAHLDPLPAGSSLLGQLMASPLNGTGLSGPVGAGIYTYLIQQTGPQVSNYGIQLVVSATPVPLPASGILLAGVFAMAAGMRRKAQ